MQLATWHADAGDRSNVLRCGADVLRCGSWGIWRLISKVDMHGMLGYGHAGTQ